MTVSHSSKIGSDRVIDALVAGLELEFGRGAAEGLAERFIAAEEGDFCWDARQEQRWLGAYAMPLDGEIELDRVAIIGRLEGKWFAAVSLIDGDERPQGVLGRRSFSSRKKAKEAFAKLH